MADSDLATVLELKKFGLKQAGELSDGSSDYDHFSDPANGIKDLEVINHIYKTLYVGGFELSVEVGEAFDWLRAREPEILTLVPPYETGSILLTQGSTAGTLSDAPPAGDGSFKGRFLTVVARDTVYRVAAHTAGSAAIILDQEYLEDTGAALDFKLIKLDYTLTNRIARLFSTMTTQKRQFDEDRTGEITFAEFRVFNQEHPLMSIVSGTPTRFTRIEEEQEIVTVRFNRYPRDKKLRVEVNYIPAPEKLAVFEFLPADVTTGTDSIAETNHGMIDDQIVEFETIATLPAGLTTKTQFFVVSATASSFKVSASKGGAAVNLTDTGTGTHTLTSVPRMPFANRMLLADYASYRILADKSDPRSDHYMRSAQALLQAMVGSNRREKRRTGRDRARLIPRRDGAYSRFYRNRRLEDC